MASAALDIPRSQQDSRVPHKASQANQPEAVGGSDQWLQWMQKLLNAHSLLLYRCDSANDTSELQLHSALPSGQQPVAKMHTLAQRCAALASIVQFNTAESKQTSIVAFPSSLGQSQTHVRHVLLVQRNVKSGPDLQTQTKLIAWGFTVLERFEQPVFASCEASDVTQRVLDQLVNSTKGASPFAPLVNELVDATRSSSCLLCELHIKANKVQAVTLLAVSGQMNIDARLNASQALLADIEQAYLRQALPLRSKNSRKAQRNLIVQTPIDEAIKTCAQLMVPICIEAQWFVVSLERDNSNPFLDSDVERLTKEMCSALQLSKLQQLAQETMLHRCKRSVKLYLQTLGNSRLKTIVAVLLTALLAVLMLVPAEHRISSPLNVEASERHVLIAPTNGFVKSIEVKAGDKVSKGQTLATLDDVELQLQQTKLVSESLQNQQAYARALAAHDRIEVTKLKEQASLVEAELAQIAQQRKKMKLVAPVDAVVLSAALDDFLGAAISTGDNLFSLGSIHSHRLVLDVSEYDVQHVALGQQVGLRLSADPSRVLDAEVIAIMPLVKASAGENTVQVHAKLKQVEALRPGMQGVGKILVGRQALGQQWLKRAAARLFWMGWKIGIIK